MGSCAKRLLLWMPVLVAVLMLLGSAAGIAPWTPRFTKDGELQAPSSGPTGRSAPPFLLMKPLQLQEAKQQFLAVADRAASGVPQVVTKHGKPFVVIISIAEWQKMHKRQGSLLKVLRSCPVDVDDLDPTRRADLPRDLSL